MVPDAKLIVILRDPVDRTYSNWAHLWADGLEPIRDFVSACREEERRAAAGWAVFWRYLWLGRYGDQLDRLFSVFPQEQAHVLRYKDLVDQPAATLNRIWDFLGVDRDLVLECPSQNVSTYVTPSARNRALQGMVRAGASIGKFFPPQVWRMASVPLLRALKPEAAIRPELPVDERRRLVDYFADDLRRLTRITGENYDDWLADGGDGTYSVRRSCAPSGRVAS